MKVPCRSCEYYLRDYEDGYIECTHPKRVKTSTSTILRGTYFINISNFSHCSCMLFKPKPRKKIKLQLPTIEEVILL